MKTRSRAKHAPISRRARHCLNVGPFDLRLAVASIAFCVVVWWIFCASQENVIAADADEIAVPRRPMVVHRMREFEDFPPSFTLAKPICVQLDLLPPRSRLRMQEKLRGACGGERVDLHRSVCEQHENVDERYLKLPWGELCPFAPLPPSKSDAVLLSEGGAAFQ